MPPESPPGEDANLIPLSALQHYLFCPRQCALIHVERLWAENVLTAEGRILHEQSDKPGQASRGQRRIVQSMPIRSRALGVAGIADVVELTREGGGWRVYPIEYKRGRPKAHRADEVQLCAQALCLEEMFGMAVPEGALFYGKVRRRTPVAFDDELRGLLVGFGRVALSPPLLGYCAEEGVAVTFLSEQGKFLARVEGPVSGNVLLRREQYRRTDDPDGCAAIVRSLVIGKALNQRAVIRRALRDHGERMEAPASATLEAAERRLTDVARRAERPVAAEQAADALRGLEDEAANVYFGAFDTLIRAQKEGFRFEGRSRRPPLDPVNALLSFVYALLVHDVRSALETVGLDPAVGFLHRDRPGRPSLALDLMEEFRPVFADRLVLSLINRRQVSGKGFRRMENGACLMTDELRKNVLVAYQERKREELRHPFLGEPTTVGLLWHLQAQLLARHLRGDLDGYPPFVWK